MHEANRNDRMPHMWGGGGDCVDMEEVVTLLDRQDD